MSCGCSCGNNGGVTIAYACSGAANTGYLSDQVARKLAADSVCRMTCLVAVAADLQNYADAAKSADKNIILDGCSVACGKKIFEARNLPFDHYILTEFGIEKGVTKITSDVINRVADEVKQKISC